MNKARFTIHFNKIVLMFIISIMSFNTLAEMTPEPSETILSYLDFSKNERTIQIYEFNQNSESEYQFHVLHGYTESCHYMWPFINQITAKGHSLNCLELPGHGKSSGKRYDIDNFDTYTLHIKAYIQTLDDNKKHIFIAHSTGAVGITKYLKEKNSNPFEHIYLISPLTRPAFWKAVRYSIPSLALLFDNIRRFEQIRSEDYNNTRDSDPDYHPYLPINWTQNCIEFVESQSKISNNTIDNVTSIFGSSDGIIDYKHGIKMYNIWFPKASVQIIEGGPHHLQFGDPKITGKLFEILLKDY